MHHHYKDIRQKINHPPLWFDEHAVPRYCKFAPDRTANIYAEQCVLLEVDCQSCGSGFLVAMTWSKIDEVLRQCRSLDALVSDDAIHYGDPPNVGCCHAGPTMNSVPRRVVEFWARGAPLPVEGAPVKGAARISNHHWRRLVEFERPIACDWANHEGDD